MFAFPESARLGKRVFKKLFEENAALTVTDRKALRDDLDVLTWAYTLKPSTVPIQPYRDDECEYLEIAVLHADLKSPKRVSRLAEIMHRAIPYPVILIFNHQSKISNHQFQISLAHKRYSQAEKGGVVADDFLAKNWIPLADPSPPKQAFLASLRFRDLPQTQFYALYSALADRLVVVACADLSGAYRLETALERRGQRRARLTECRALEARIQGLRRKIRKETQFNRQVELNTQIKQLAQELRGKAAHL
jgi:hypothetical protein